MATINLVRKTSQRSKIKHIQINYFYACARQKKEVCEIVHVSSENQLIDFSRDLYQFPVSSLSLSSKIFKEIERCQEKNYQFCHRSVFLNTCRDFRSEKNCVRRMGKSIFRRIIYFFRQTNFLPCKQI